MVCASGVVCITSDIDTFCKPLQISLGVCHKFATNLPQFLSQIRLNHEKAKAPIRGYFEVKIGRNGGIRTHAPLLPTHECVLEQYDKIKHLAVKDGLLRKASGYAFYNTSPFTFETLRADAENIEDNFRAFINGFLENVQDILTQMGFSDQIKRMADSNLLYQVIVDFCSEKADMSPEKVTAVDMGYIFENLVQRFSESYDEEAGAHFTSRDIIYAMCDLLVTGNAGGDTKTIYDMTMGTSQMLTCMEERLHQLDNGMETTTFGQELNPFTYGIAKADMLIRGGNPDNMKFGDTLNILKTLGARSTVYNDIARVAAHPVDRVVDTTGSGDTFIGYFIAERLRGAEIAEAMETAAAASAWCIRHPGAAPSIPRRADLSPNS